jgi:hypothetical protein
MSRFVLLDHDHPQPHVDFMLEVAGVLWTWRFDEMPTSEIPVVAVRIGDHRIEYLDYEGSVSGNRGRVIRLDRGEFVWVERTDSRIVVGLEGHGLRGLLTLTHLEAARWQALLERSG